MEQCPEHSGIMARLELGEDRFTRIDIMIQDFKKDMNAIAKQLADEVRELRAYNQQLHQSYLENLSEMGKSFSVVINGDAEKNIRGHEQRLDQIEKGIAGLWKVLILEGTILLGFVTYMLQKLIEKVMI